MVDAAYGQRFADRAMAITEDDFAKARQKGKQKEKDENTRARARDREECLAAAAAAVRRNPWVNDGIEQEAEEIDRLDLSKRLWNMMNSCLRCSKQSKVVCSAPEGNPRCRMCPARTGCKWQLTQHCSVTIYDEDHRPKSLTGIPNCCFDCSYAGDGQFPCGACKGRAATAFENGKTTKIKCRIPTSDNLGVLVWTFTPPPMIKRAGHSINHELSRSLETMPPNQDAMLAFHARPGPSALMSRPSFISDRILHPLVIQQAGVLTLDTAELVSDLQAVCELLEAAPNAPQKLVNRCYQIILHEEEQSYTLGGYDDWVEDGVQMSQFWVFDPTVTGCEQETTRTTVSLHCLRQLFGVGKLVTHVHNHQFHDWNAVSKSESLEAIVSFIMQDQWLEHGEFQHWFSSISSRLFSALTCAQEIESHRPYTQPMRAQYDPKDLIPAIFEHTGDAERQRSLVAMLHDHTAQVVAFLETIHTAIQGVGQNRHRERALYNTLAFLKRDLPWYWFELEHGRVTKAAGAHAQCQLQHD